MNTISLSAKPNSAALERIIPIISVSALVIARSLIETVALVCATISHLLISRLLLLLLALTASEHSTETAATCSTSAACLILKAPFELSVGKKA